MLYTVYKQFERYREKKIIRVAKYGRCSSDEQKKNGYTIGDQLTLLDDFCQENELVSVGEYIDEGISATLEISKRKALAQLIKDAKAGKFDIVIFKCIDRFFRNVGEYYECQKQLRKAGVTWISIEESDLDPEDDDAAFKINIYLTMAEYEAKKTSKRIKFNNKMRIKNKQVVTGQQCFLFPWKVVGEKRNRHLERNMDNAPMLYDLLEFYEMHQSKSATIGYILDKYDYTMNIDKLNHLLTDTLLFGEYKGVADYVEPYITKERFDNLQEIMKKNASYGKVNNRVFAFSGLIKCPGCGRNLVGNYYKKNDSYNYRCNKHRIEKTCNFRFSLNEKMIEQQLLDNLEQYVDNAISRVEYITAKAEEKTDNTKKIKSIKKEMDRLNMMFRKGRIDEEEYDKEFLILENDLKKYEVVEKPVEIDLSGLKELLESDYKTMYNQLDRPHRKAFWRKLIKEFSVDNDKKIIPGSINFF